MLGTGVSLAEQEQLFKELRALLQAQGRRAGQEPMEGARSPADRKQEPLQPAIRPPGEQGKQHPLGGGTLERRLYHGVFLSQTTLRLTLAGMVNLIALSADTVAAEQLCCLDLMTAGQRYLGVADGHGGIGRQQPWAAMGVRQSRSAPRKTC